MKLKKCSICLKDCYLFKANPPTCVICYKSKPINKVSKTHKQTLAKYKPKRLEFLSTRPRCELKLEGCTNLSTVIHHKKGKSSPELYLDEQYWMASCMSCNFNVEHIPDPYGKGLKIRRNEL